MKHLEILAYAMNAKSWCLGTIYGTCWTTEAAKDSQVDCGFGTLFNLKLVEDETVGTILTALDSIIANPFGKAYTHNQFIGARKELLELAGCRDQQTLREVVCPDR